MSLDELLDVRRHVSLLLHTDELDLIDLRSAGAVLKRNVIACNGRFYCRDEHEVNEFELRAIAEYQDSAYRRRVQMEILRQQLADS